MRIVVLTVPNHYYANYILVRLLGTFGPQVAAIFESETLLPSQSFLRALGKYLRVSGFYYVACQGVKQTLFRVCQRFYRGDYIANPFYSYKRLASNLKIPIHHSANINSDLERQRLADFQPDLIVSVFFNQILKPRVLRVPPQGCINIHPAYLPSYRGISPVFWALSNGEDYSGVTIHRVDEGIDTGRILRQRRIKIAPSDTEHSLYCKCSQAGAPLLLDVIKSASQGRIDPVQSAEDQNAQLIAPSYYSVPTREAVRIYKQRGRAFFFISELFKDCAFSLD